MNFQIYYHNLEMYKLIEAAISEEIFEVKELISNITEEEIIVVNENFVGRTKSISKPLSSILEEKFEQLNWRKGILIFNTNNQAYKKERWSLDYFKKRTSVEVAFNHEEGTAWNIFKGLIASKPNKINKNINVECSVIITATKDLMTTGGFDSAIGTYEKYKDYLMAFEQIVNYPIILIGLNGVDSFYIKHNQVINKKIAKIERRG